MNREELIARLREGRESSLAGMYMAQAADMLEADGKAQQEIPTARTELLALAERCGARLTGTPDGNEAITIVFTIPAWRAFDASISKYEFDNSRQPRMTLDEIIDLAVDVNLGRKLKPIGLDTGDVFYTDASYKTSALNDFARAIEKMLRGK